MLNFILGAGTCSTTGGSGGWLCQHRWIAISGMVGFRNNVGSNALSNWSSPQGDRIAFGRGSAGFVAINNNSGQWSGTFSSALPAGTYCDVISGKKSGSSCTGITYVFLIHSAFLLLTALFSVTVSSSGSFSASVASRSAIAIHTGARL